MDVTPAGRANIKEILDVFANEYAPVTYCVFEINGEVRVVTNEGGGRDHAEVRVIKILNDDMEGILGRNERITLYMNYSPCNDKTHKCADNIRDLKVANKGLQLTIIYANFYFYDKERNKEGIISLIKNCLTLNTFTMNDWIKLKALLVRWYGVEIVPESVTTNDDFYQLYGGRKENDKKQNTQLEVLKQNVDTKLKKRITELRKKIEEQNEEINELEEVIKELKIAGQNKKKILKNKTNKIKELEEEIKELEIAGGNQHEDEDI